MKPTNTVSILDFPSTIDLRNVCNDLIDHINHHEHEHEQALSEVKTKLVELYDALKHLPGNIAMITNTIQISIPPMAFICNQVIDNKDDKDHETTWEDVVKYLRDLPTVEVKEILSDCDRGWRLKD